MIPLWGAFSIFGPHHKRGLARRHHKAIEIRPSTSAASRRLVPQPIGFCAGDEGGCVPVRMLSRYRIFLQSHVKRRETRGGGACEQRRSNRRGKRWFNFCLGVTGVSWRSSSESLTSDIFERAGHRVRCVIYEFVIPQARMRELRFQSSVAWNT